MSNNHLKLIQMKTLFFAIAFLISMNLSYAQSKAVFTQQIAVEGGQDLEMNLKNEYEIKDYLGEEIKIEINIHLPNVGNATLKYLNQIGYFKLCLEQDLDKQILREKACKKSIKVNGKVLKQAVTYTIYVPIGIKILPVLGKDALASR